MSKPKQKVQKSRRKLLGVLATGAVATKLPDVWSKPTVASVMLPAHAAGSPASPCDSANVNYVNANFGNGSVTINAVGAAYGLSNNRPVIARLEFPGGSRADTAGYYPTGTHFYTLGPGATVPDTVDVCGGSITVSFYYVGTPEVILCSDTAPMCQTATIITIIDTV